VVFLFLIVIVCINDKPKVMINNNQNVSKLQSLVGTKYGDLNGLIEIDNRNSIAGFDTLLTEDEISSGDYFLVGIGFSDFTLNGVGENSQVCCVALLLETQKYGYTFEDIKTQLLLNSKVDIIKKSFQMKYAELGKYIKKVDAALLDEMGRYIKEMNIINGN
jgi:hypothetical protein